MLGEEFCVPCVPLLGAICATAAVTKNANATQTDSDIFLIAALLLVKFDDRSFSDDLSDRPV
jgi:hypothetical protein